MTRRSVRPQHVGTPQKGRNQTAGLNTTTSALRLDYMWRSDRVWKPASRHQRPGQTLVVGKSVVHLGGQAEMQVALLSVYRYLDGVLKK